MWLANIFNVSQTSAYWTLQMLLFAFLLWLLFYQPTNKFWSVVLGIIFAVELTHLWEALASGSYAPGFWTAIPLVILGVLFWKVLIKNYPAYSCLDNLFLSFYFLSRIIINFIQS